MKLIKNGITRWVILTKKYAIKFPNPSYSLKHFLKGWIANMQEKESWKFYNSIHAEEQYIKDQLCPVLNSYFYTFFIIMPKVEEIKDDNFIGLDDLQYVCNDHKKENYGILNGKVVCIDYGK